MEILLADYLFSSGIILNLDGTNVLVCWGLGC